jgi:hypothetical protein
MTPQYAATSTHVDRGSYKVDVPLDPPTLLPRLHDIGIWLMEWEIPHQARVSMQPRHDRLRISFPDERHAHAFQMKFGGVVVDGDPPPEGPSI